MSDAGPAALLAMRAGELAALESAALVLSATLNDTDLIATNDRLELLHDQVWRLSALLHTCSGEGAVERAAADFAKINNALSHLRRRARDQMRLVDLAKLRPAIPQLARSHRTDVVSVLDLCLGDLERFDDLWPLIDLLIARLATDDVGPERKLGYEPSELTPLLSQLCDQASDLFAPAAQDAVAAFEAGAADVEAAGDFGELEQVIHRIYDFKHELGMKVLLPEVLRSSVIYNMTVANRVDALHRDDGEVIASLDMDLDFLDEKKPAAPAPAASTSPYEHAGMVAITASLRARLGQGEDPDPGGAAGVIAAGADFSKLSEDDRAVLLGSCEAAPPEALLPLIVVGLIVAQKERIESELAVLGIDRRALEEEWVPEVRKALRAELRYLIHSGRYAETRGPSGTLSRLLPLWATSTASRKRAAAPVPIRTIAADAIDLRASITERRRKRRRVARPWLIAPLLLLAALLVGRVALGPLDMTRPLEEAEIQAISAHIGSAERGRFGYGPHLAGVLEASWYWMTPRQQYRAALQIAYRLREAGVSSAILYGRQRQPVILMQHGNLIAPVAPR